MEILATKAERDSIKLMQIKYMLDKEGKIFEAVISGVTARGVFVEVVENKCEGLVKAKDLPGDFYVHDEKNHLSITTSNNLEGVSISFFIAL